MPRPVKRTKDQVIKAIRAARGALYTAARKLKVDYSTMQRYVKRWKAVATAVREERGLMIDQAQGVVGAALDNNEAWAAQYVLSTIGAKRGWYKRDKVSVNMAETDREIEKLLAEVVAEAKREVRAEIAAAAGRDA
jgi:hypothetical protein